MKGQAPQVQRSSKQNHPGIHAAENDSVVEHQHVWNNHGLASRSIDFHLFNSTIDIVACMIIFQQ